MPLRILLILLTFFSVGAAYCQNLETIGQEKPLKVSGGINFNNVFYGSKGIDARRDPYSYFLTGNLNLDIYGWVVPFYFTLSNQNNSFQQPFNQYSLHPTYKWVTAHLGYTSMTFSPYTLNGHIFRGAGIDVAPDGKFKVSAMYGRLQRAVEPDTLNDNAETPAFKRMGFGLKTSYLSNGNTLDVIIFHAQDDKNSIRYIPEDDLVLPQENLVLSIAGGKKIFERILLQAEFASSAITRDTRAASLEFNTKNAFSYVGPLYTQRSSSAYYSALKSGVSYQGKRFTLGTGYERVAPGYRTLGAYFFNNDLQNITVNASTSLLKGKLNLAGNAGRQRDNLDNSKISTMRRFVGAVNIGYNPFDRLSITTAYSNFNTYTNIRSKFVDINQLTPYDNIDTLNFTQLSESANINVNYVFPANEVRRQNINVNVTVQEASDQQGGVEQPGGSRFFNVNSAYTLTIVPNNIGVSLAFNLNQNKMATVSTTTLGPTLGVRKSFLDKKLNATISASLNNAYTDSQLISKVSNVRVGCNYTVEKKHHLSLSTVVLNRKNTKDTGTAEFTEFTGTVGYSYTF